jgi:tRNA G18 (ribose-2'-O)-methylase SpoU
MSAEDKRNVIDFYKGWKLEDIKLDLERKRFDYAVLMEQFQGDFNIGTVIRNANIFAAKEVFYIGKKRWDRRGAVGSHHYTSLKYLASYDDLVALKEQYVFIGMDNVVGSVPMESFEWPKNSLMIFGEESTGITQEVLALCDKVVAITQYGSVRSLNAAVASGISMYDYTNKLRGV